jgi:hypothetical protein
MLMLGSSQASIERAWQWYTRWKVAAKHPLLRGQDLMAITGEPPGPAVGRLAARLRIAQTLSQVRTAEEAQAWLQERAGS